MEAVPRIFVDGHVPEAAKLVDVERRQGTFGCGRMLWEAHKIDDTRLPGTDVEQRAAEC